MLAYDCSVDLYDYLYLLVMCLCLFVAYDDMLCWLEAVLLCAVGQDT